MTLEQLLNSVLETYSKRGRAFNEASAAAAFLRPLSSLEVVTLAPEVFYLHRDAYVPKLFALELFGPDYVNQKFSSSMSFLEYCAAQRGIDLAWLPMMNFVRSDWNQELGTEDVTLVYEYSWRLCRVRQEYECFRGTKLVLGESSLGEIPGQTTVSLDALRSARDQMTLISRFPLKGWDTIAKFLLALCRNDEELSELVSSLLDVFARFPSFAAFKDEARYQWANRNLRRSLPAHLLDTHWLDPSEPAVSQNLTPAQLAILASEQSPESGGSGEASQEVRAPNRLRVDAYIDDVFTKKQVRITRKDIWVQAGYKNATQFERWQRGDPRPNVKATKRFERIIETKPHLRDEILRKFL